MKFFHLSDLHIGKQLHFYSLKEDQEKILNEIAEYAGTERPQAIVIAGDVYDKSVPAAEAVAVFDGFVRRIAELGIDLLLISGNHDSPERLAFASALLEKQHLYIGGLLPENDAGHLKKVTFSDEWGKVTFWLLPFLKPGYVKGLFGEEPASYTEAVEKILEREDLDHRERNVLVTHQFFTAEGREPERSASETVYVGGTGNVDISAVQDFDYVAMGHLHKAQPVGSAQFRYCGAPLKYSAAESGDEKKLTVVTLKEKGMPPVIETLPLHPLRDVRCLTGRFEELMEQGCRDYVSVTLTDERLPYQPRERLGTVFPNLLEIKVDNARTRMQMREPDAAGTLESPMELFEKFYQEMHGTDMTEKEKEIIREIIGQAQEEEG